MNVFCGKKTARRKLVSIFIVSKPNKQNELETIVTTFLKQFSKQKEKKRMCCICFDCMFYDTMWVFMLCKFSFQSFKLHTKDCANKYIFNTSRRKTLNKLQAMTLCLKTILYYLQTNISMKANNTIE